MRLWELAGLTPETAADDRAKHLLREHAEQLLEVCVVTLDDWAGLDRYERAALVAAARRLKARHACRLANAIHRDHAAVLAELDPDAADMLRVADAVSREAGRA